ncbi:hypothetical protein [Vibrio sp. L3-7]|uniref:hypothetical protein n=1 Tax=Vibrio sp. L3-7 TaxID=2912253 RepID=UPI001F38DBF5|nr:hypothetical protein [Vibrio sp. L3-7]MCF7507253.1 hypothetical protein [Vibrio sp. L3-7]
MDIFKTITLGIVVGILTSLSLFILKQFFYKTLIPFWQKSRYQGADISGSWRADFIPDDESETTLTFILQQNAHSISGSMSFKFVNPTVEEYIEFDLVGNYWESYLCLNAQSKDKKTFSGGTMYLQSLQNGSTFNGYFAFRDAGLNSVKCIPMVITRK